jgi:hypothetical protein
MQRDLEMFVGDIDRISLLCERKQRVKENAKAAA